MPKKLLIDGHPLQVIPELALAIGLPEAIVLQQVHYLVGVPNIGKEINGQKWVWNTYEQWQQGYFCFWSVSTIKRIFQSLEAISLIESIQPDKGNRQKYYRTGIIAETFLTQDRMEYFMQIKMQELEKEKHGVNLDAPSDQIEPMHGVKLSPSRARVLNLLHRLQHRNTPRPHRKKNKKAPNGA